MQQLIIALVILVILLFFVFRPVRAKINILKDLTTLKTHTVNISSTTITVGSTGSINADAKGFSGGTRGDGTGPGKGLGGSSGELGASGAGYGRSGRRW